MTPEQQYKTVTTAITNKLNQIQDGLPSQLLALNADSINNLDDRANFNKLRDCITTIVNMGGRKTDKDGTCLSKSGYSLDSLRTQFQTFTDQNVFLAPAAAVDKVVADVNKYLDSVQLVPATEQLIAAATASINSVVKTVSALDQDATNKAFDCFLQAIQVRVSCCHGLWKLIGFVEQVISSVPLAQREALCNTGNGNGVDGTALKDLQTAYISRVNQYASGLPPLVARDIQAIGIEAMSLKVGSYDEALRKEINTAINSQVSITAGESNEIVAALISMSLSSLYWVSLTAMRHRLLEHSVR